ncbi:glycosyl hydrolase family 28-related protein [Anoxybacillus sp. CHMUD]|uniref:glycosyl hydrolase family 28-related protein n=1 Tax=Anoxybacillus sp. CHMUD TaxID=2508870 RepID=UPI0014932826|nr:glycosyl hydrolase family 28-related protein [Anoxybacillus sp. CHMUD]NNU89754.1 hypothetical protein [Anoxybacillus sp. CHMUD]
MATYQTPNIGLNKWAETDYFKRVEINENFDKIDNEIGILSTFVVNVKSFGAKGDGVTNDAPAIQNAINSLTNGGIVYIPPGTYLIGTSLTVPSNITIRGAGMDVTILKDHSSLGANRIFYIQGTSDSYIKNICIECLTIQNGTAQTGAYTSGKDGIRIEYVDGFRMCDCKITEIQGAYGLVTKFSKNIHVLRNIFYRVTYSGMTVLVECENIKVLDNIFDTVTSTNYANVYTFATGGEKLNEGQFFLKNLWVERNKFLNNPLWEGIDTHGGENIFFRKNYIENTSVGINCQSAVGYVSNPVLKNVFIEDNIIKQSTGRDGNGGIVVTGGSSTSPTNIYYAENIIIRSNKIDGFGGTSSSTVGSIILYRARKVTIEDNHIENFAQSGVLLYHTLEDVTIRNNKILNMRTSYDAGNAFIGIRSGVIYGVTVENNYCESADMTKTPKYFLYILSSSFPVNIQARNNTVKNVSTSLYGNIGNLPFDKDTQPSGNRLVQKFGDVIIGTTGKNTFVVSSPKIGYGCVDTTVVPVTVNATAGSNIATIASNVTGDYRWLPVGMNITIAGAGASGADLNARILENDGTNLTLDTTIGTTVSGANVNYQGLTFTAL